MATNPILDNIRNSQKEVAAAKAGEELPTVSTPMQETPAAPQWEPKAGEVLFEPIDPNLPVRTALPSGVEVGFPYIAADEDEIEFLTGFADHCGMLTVTEGK